MGKMFSGRPSHTTGYGDLSVRHYHKLCLGTTRALGFESFSFVLHSISQPGAPYHMSNVISGPCIFIYYIFKLCFLEIDSVSLHSQTGYFSID